MRLEKPPLALLLVLLTASSLPALAAEKAWLTSADEAFARAEANDQQILVDLYADWCIACRALQTEIFPTDVFQKRIADMVLLRVDVMDQGEGADLMARYNVQKLPTTIVLSPQRVRLAAVEGFMGAEELIERLDKDIAGYQNLRGALDKVLAADSPELQKKLAQDFHQRLDGASAARIYEKLLTTADLPAEERADLLFFAADAHRLAGDFTHARERSQQAEAAAAASDDHDLLPRIDLLSYYIARNQGDCVRAEALLEGFIEKHPDTTYTRDVRRFLRDLKKGDRHGCLDATAASL